MTREKDDGKILPLGMLLSYSDVRTLRSEPLGPGKAPGKCSGLTASLI